MTSPSTLLWPRIDPVMLEPCICGEPIFRHRIGRRQISCDDVRRIDQAFKASGAPSQQPRRDLHLVTSGRDSNDQGGVR